MFERELVQQKLGARAWLIGFWGIGTYKRNDEVDVRYELDGPPMVAHALEIIPPEGEPLALGRSTRADDLARTHGCSSRSADRIARVAGERLSV